jgi:hypothetical protein
MRRVLRKSRLKESLKIRSIRFFLLASGFEPSEEDENIAETARFAEALLGQKSKNVRSGQVYNILRRPFVKGEKEKKENLDYLASLFGSLGLAEIVKMIEEANPTTT